MLHAAPQGGIQDEDLLSTTHSEDTLIGTAFLTGYRVELDSSTNIIRIEKTAVKRSGFPGSVRKRS